MLSGNHYSQNYAGIIRPTLVTLASLQRYCSTTVTLLQLEAAKNNNWTTIVLAWEPAVFALKGYEQGTCQQVTDNVWEVLLQDFVSPEILCGLRNGQKHYCQSVTSPWSCIGKCGQGEAEAKLSHGGQITNLKLCINIVAINPIHKPDH